MDRDFLAVAESHYKAVIDKSALTMRVYMTSPVGVGEHPQIFDEFLASFEAYSDAVDRFFDQHKSEFLLECQIPSEISFPWKPNELQYIR